MSMRVRVIAALLLTILCAPMAAEAACWLAQSTAVDIGLGPFVAAADGAAQTGLTISQADVRLKKNTAAWAQKNDSNACSHQENGWYECAFNTTDTDALGRLTIAINESGALPVFLNCMVLPATVYAALTTNAVGAANGFVLNGGSNAGTTTFGAMTVTGALTISDGLVVARSSSNQPAATFTGNGTGNGITIASGSGATGTGLAISSAATNGTAVTLSGAGTGRALTATGGATGAAVGLVGGGTSGAGLTISTTSGDGISVTPTAGHGLVLTANGTSKHGFTATGGTAGTSHGMLATAGTGGSAFLVSSGITVDACTGCSSAGGTTLQPGIALVKGSTSVIVDLFIRDASSNLGKTGLDDGDAGLEMWYCRVDQGNAACTDIPPANSTRGSYTSGGFVEKDATNAPGIYEIGLPTGALATGADWVAIYYQGITDTLPTVLKIELVDTGLAAINTKLGTPAGSSISADIATVDTVVDAIKAKTDSLAFTGGNVNSIVNSYASGQAPLQPTTSGRTLDVSAAGNAGIDWSNVEAPTTANNLSGTTISTSQVAASVTGNVGGNVAGSVGSVAAGGIAASSFAAGAIDATAIAADAITSSELAATAASEIATAVGAVTLAELSQGTPSATPSLSAAIMALYMALRNQTDTTSGQISYTNDAGTVIFKCTLADNGTTLTKSECVSGP